MNEIPDDAVIEEVTNTNNHVLSPSNVLLKSYKNGDIDWFEYKTRFKQEMLDNPEALEKMFEIYVKSQTHDVYLICYESDCIHCHRSILKDMIENRDFMKGENGVLHG